MRTKAIGRGLPGLARRALDEIRLPRPTGQFEELEAGCVVLALGQESDLSLLASMPEVLVADGAVQAGSAARSAPTGEQAAVLVLSTAPARA